MKSLKPTIVITSFRLAMVCGTARASLIWTCGSSLSTFKSIEFQDNDNNYGSNNGSSVTRIPDDGGAGRFHKDNLDRRCEAKGANGFTPARGSTYYIGWRFRLSSTHDNNCIFQWKS